MNWSNSSDVPGTSPFGIKRSVRRVISNPILEQWVQQCMTFELIDNIGTTGSPGFGRCIRISTAGSLINTAAYRGSSDEVDPFARSLDEQINWTSVLGNSKSTIPTRYDNLMILDDLHLTISATDPISQYPNVKEEINQGTDWFVVDMSPTTKNKDSIIDTSTNLGANVGVFGDVPTAGIEYSSSNSHEWSLPDYDIFSMAGASNDNPRAVWHIQRSDLKSDPNIARSALRPNLEVIFGLRSHASPKRYSSITAMMHITFIQNKVDIKEKAEDIIFSRLPFSGIVRWLTKGIVNSLPIFKDGKKLARHTFMITFVVDWLLGRVSAYIPDDAGDSKAILYSVSDDENQEQSGFLPAEEAKKLLTPEIDHENAIKDLRLSFIESSAIGLANIEINSKSIIEFPKSLDILYPINVLAGYAEKFQVYSGYPVTQIISNSQWLPFKRAARIDAHTNYELNFIWSMPNGYNRDSVWTIISPPTKGNGTGAVIEKNSSSEIIKLPEVPDSYYTVNLKDRNQAKLYECVLLRDNIILMDSSGERKNFKSCFNYLTSAVFGDDLSIGISMGSIVLSKDYFETPVLTKNAPDLFQNGDYKALNDFIYGCNDAWLCRVKNTVLIFAHNKIATFDFQDAKRSQLVTKLQTFHWKEWVKDTNDRSSDNSLCFLANVISRTGNLKPITGWSGAMDSVHRQWLQDANSEMLFQKEI